MGQEAGGKKLGAAKMSVFINMGLLATKIVIAFITNSIGLYAESAHSFFDLLASVLAYLGIRKAEEPEDHSHHFGHEKFENLSSLLQALLITGTAGIVLFEAYQKFSEPTVVEFSELGIGLMLISIPVTLWTSQYLRHIAEKEGSSALEADSAHFTTDVISSVAVLVGLILVKFGFAFGDPLAAIVVGLVMLYISIELMLKSFHVFMDFSPSKETMDKIQTVLDNEEEITLYHKLRARLAGSKILIDVHIHVPPKTSVAEGHRIAHDIETKIMRIVPEVKEVNVHVEPD